LTGLAGTLWVPLTGHVTPETLHWPFSGEILFLTLLGGFRNFTGPIIGGIVYNYLKVYAVASTDYWQFVLGTALVIIVLTMPGGIVGLMSRITGWIRQKLERYIESAADN
jgi:branched-chain amino acid transport system permease protein